MSSDALPNNLIFPNEPLRFDANNFEPLLAHCSNLGASDITLQSNEPVVVEVHGKLHQITKHKLATPEVGDILNLLYGPNGTTQLLSGTDVDTHYEFRPNRNDRFRYRVNATSCQVEGHHGIQITLRTIPNLPPTLQDLQIEDRLTSEVAPKDGVVYVTGATGSGKSTLLAAIIRSIIEQPDCNRKVLTYEAPIEFVFDSVIKPSAVVSQSEIPHDLPSFAAGVRNALRRKPKLILVGEARDTETIAAVIEAALTGHPVYTTLHTTGVPETIRRLVGTFPADERAGRCIDIIETARLIVCQKLVPSTDGKQVALREFLVFDEKVRDALLNTDPNQVTATTRKLLNEYGQTLLQDAKAKLDAGKIYQRDYDLIAKTYAAR